MEEYTQADVAGLRELLRNGDFQKLQRVARDRIEALRAKKDEVDGDIRLDDHTARMTQLRLTGEIKGLSYFIEKAEKMVKALVTDEGGFIPQKKEKK
jgi:hypothetical protein